MLDREVKVTPGKGDTVVVEIGDVTLHLSYKEASDLDFHLHSVLLDIDHDGLEDCERLYYTGEIEL